MIGIGDQVVCVDDSPARIFGVGGPKHLRQNAVYTVRGFAPTGGIYVEEAPCIIVTPLGATDLPWHRRRFRPVRRNETDISVFEELLNPTPEKLAELGIDEVDEDEELEVIERS